MEGKLSRDSTSSLEPRPRAYTPVAMVARVWSGLMCLETHGTRGSRQTLDLGGVAESLTHGRLNSTYVSENPRWACRWWRSASRCIPDGNSGRDVGMGTGVADGPDIRRAGRRRGPKNTGPSAGRVGALGGSRETRRNSNFDRVASFKFPPLFSTSATLKPVRENTSVNGDDRRTGGQPGLPGAAARMLLREDALGEDAWHICLGAEGARISARNGKCACAVSRRKG